VTESGDQPVFRDRRRVDPDTGDLREPQEPAAPGPAQPDAQAAGQPVGGEPAPGEAVGGEPVTGGPPPGQHRDPAMDPDVQAATGAEAGAAAGEQPDRVTELETALSERTLDLQRLQAEYVNYKRRVDRDREVVREGATASVLTALLPVLDDIDRARDHGELEGGFKAVADAFVRTVSGLGLERFGEVGDEFDPRVHEALMHEHSDNLDGPTCTAILQPGYRIGERVVRPARVAVSEPSTDPAGATVDPGSDPGDTGSAAPSDPADATGGPPYDDER
jgi:molecular chaperone GrpE